MSTRVILGPLEKLSHEKGVTDIAVTSDGVVWVDSGQGMQQRSVHASLESPEVLRDFAVSLCAQLGRRLDDACPIADASTRSGLRVHAVIEPIVSQGAALSIRIPNSTTPTLDQLCAFGAFSPYIRDFLTNLVASRASVLISGGTGSGKTTLLRALIHECEHNDRIVIVEEIRELGSANHQGIESLVAREANIEDAGEIGLPDLVKATVRMRPDRIILGECRGEELADLLRAFNSGHKGGMATIHADSIERLPARLIGLGLLADMKPQATAMMVVGAFDVVIHLTRENGHRYLAQIGRLDVLADGSLSGTVMAEFSQREQISAHPQWKAWIQHFIPKTDEHLAELSADSNDEPSDELGDEPSDETTLIRAIGA